MTLCSTTYPGEITAVGLVKIEEEEEIGTSTRNSTEKIDNDIVLGNRKKTK